VKPSHTLAAVAAVSLSLALGGCISLFPKSVPAQLYSFGAGAPSQAPVGASGPQVNVLRVMTTFPAAAGGDRILTVDGQQIAYIAGSRWVSPASILFDQAETFAFDGSAGPARLIQRGEMVHAEAELRLDVEAFEARYPGSMTASPTVVVRVRAVMTGLGNRNSVEAQTFESRQPVGSNRVGEIVGGFDTATNDVLRQVVDWTNQRAAALPPEG
jgi:cholesterol transport system auxiliary component